MQPNNMAEKRRVYIDGDEIPGLVYSGELRLEKGTIDVPEFQRIRKIANGVSVIPPYELRYKISRGTNTLKFFQDWYNNNEIKDVTVVRTDAHGAEFGRTLMSECECHVKADPEADMANPTYAMITIIILPFEITDLDAE
jgi:hypothetical protein